ncbi:cation-transporting P-type ATPase [Pontixanthobacter gangjinensis]|uniref:Cation-transporting P-type ATPase n=1 Tax=Christiangramia aestuarii TaxID=1028746 RepID=A0A7K1LPC7_9FLAO|nr:cation-transporting P-type ATPase [Christiangramia aestuarii]MUP42647.1 cation-transporting P-type ATPase [Christiangramia aestuarii]
MLSNPHSLAVEEVIAQLGSNQLSGLNEQESAKRLKSFGPNVLSRNKPKNAWQILLEQLLSPIVYILIGAMFLAFFFSETIEALAILLVIIINTLIGFVMEYQAIKSFTALEKMVQTNTRVLRNAKEIDLASRFLVPGDIILLNAGDVVPADARIIQQESLLLKESMLTGESAEVSKNKEVLAEETRITEQKNMLFNGTLVSRGNAKAIVTSTGDQTAIGEISSLTQQKNEKRAPLQKKLSSLTNWLIVLTLGLAGIIVLTGFLGSNDAELMLKTGIALAVAAIPEGLPVVATITLARGMLKLSKQKVVIKKLESVQTLGETNIICTDKTGTLTENKMHVSKIEVENARIGSSDFPALSQEQLEIYELVKVAVLCNNSNPEKSNNHGDAIDEALIDFVQSTSFKMPDILKYYPEVRELAFDVEKKLMATVNQYDNGFIVHVKGAPENILERCNFIYRTGKIEEFENKEEWLEKVEVMASEGLKVLAFANKSIYAVEEEKPMLSDLVFIGISGFLDPPREDIAQTIKIYNEAGISVKMITGDHPGTASNIARAIGIIKEENNEKPILGTWYPDFSTLDAENKNLVLKASVFARMLPAQKLDLVRFFQKNEGVVGMLGDGVNDAPALKEADIGIAMGVRGTEAAKEVADVILLDDKFTAIRLAIQQGRAIFENIRYFVIFLISCNLAEVISVSIASFTDLPLPLLPMQILYLNLVTDIFPALALGMGKGSKGIMKNRPRPAGEELLTRKHWMATITYGLSITLSVIGIVIFAHEFLGSTLKETNNMAFNTLVLAQLINIFNLPKKGTSFFKNEITANKWVWIALLVSIFITYLGYRIEFLAEILSLGSLSFREVIISVIFALGSLLISQLIKSSGIFKGN